MAKGIRFANAYATIPLCAPCRAEIATGLSPFRTGLVDLNRLWRDVLPPTEAWAFDLRRAGFRTFTTGKTDGTYTPMPAAYSRLLFHEEPAIEPSGTRRGRHDYWDRGPGIRGINHPDDDGSCDGAFYDYWVAQHAIDYLARADPGRRHLIQLGFKHPHYDLVCPDRFYQIYDADRIRWPASAAPEDLHGPQPGMATYERSYIVNGQFTPEKAGEDGWRQVTRGYFAACSHMDHELGRFLDALAASALGSSTTVVVLSDNGFNLGTHDSFHKMSQWDAAAHVPLGIWSPRMTEGREVALPVSLHNLPKTILDLAGLPPRPHWTSGQSLLPLIDPSFGAYDRAHSPVTCVFGTLSVRPSAGGLEHLRYFRYPNGEEHVYDLDRDPGETVNIAGDAPLDRLREELVTGALRLGLDLSGMETPATGVSAMMAVDGTVALAGGLTDTQYWAYGANAEKIDEAAEGGTDTLWYMGGPDDYVLKLPPHVEQVRIATVRARLEADGETPKTLRIVAHPSSPIRFETSERVEVELVGSEGDDEMVGPRWDGATFHGGGGNDRLVALSKRRKSRHVFHGGAGNDVLLGGQGRDTLDGGTGDDTINGGVGRNLIEAGHGDDTVTDGPEASLIRLGPGDNRLTSAGGDDVVEIGAGENVIEGGPGATTYRIAYGGVTTIRDWRPADRLDLATWPAAPRLHVVGTDLHVSLGNCHIVLEGQGATGLTLAALTRSPGGPAGPVD